MSAATLIDTVIYKDSTESKALLKELALVGGGVAMLGLLAQVVIPLVPVPITGQTLGVLVLGASYGSRRALITMIAYLLLGAAGLPLFAEAGSGTAVLFGATGGYLIGMTAAAWLMGFFSEKKQDRKLTRVLAIFALGHTVIFACGLAWLAQLMSWEQAIAVGFTPFIPGMIIKTLIASGVMPTAWRIVGK